MKIHIFLFVILISIVFASCKSETNPSEQISGLWNYQIIEDFECNEAEMNRIINFGNASCEEENGNLNCLNGTINFLDGNLTQTFNYLIDGILDNRVVETGTYAFDDINETQLTLCMDTICMTGLISFTESSLIFNAVTDTCRHRFVAFK